MLDFSPEKMMMIFFIVMLVLGPEKLPEIARKAGKITAELRKLSSGFQNEIRQAMHETTSMDGVNITGDGSSPTSTTGTTPSATTSDSTATVVRAGDASTGGQQPPGGAN